ncbi:MAG: VaFE repeat-containing surface-anchored protein [Clostridiales bacterium]|nr:VaFE repeat-containing surface-anchored protein [Clostridiales bacterium]
MPTFSRKDMHMKKTKKNIIRSLAAAIATVIAMSPIVSNVRLAAWGTPISSGNIKMTHNSKCAQLYNSNDTSVDRNCNAKSVLNNGHWVPVYCIEKGKYLNDTDHVTAEMYNNSSWCDQYGMTVRDALGMIYVCGYNGENGWGSIDTSIFNHDADDAALMANSNYHKYVATQALIWEVTNDTTYYSRNSSVQGEIDCLRSRISNYRNRATLAADTAGSLTLYHSVADAKAHTNVPTARNGNTAHFAYGYSDAYNPSNYTYQENWSLVTNRTTTDFTTSTVNETITLGWTRKYGSSAAAGQAGTPVFNLDANDAEHLWGVVLWRPDNGNQLTISATASTESVYASFIFDFTRDEYQAVATLNTTKVDDQGNPSRGATFTVYKADGTSFGTMTDAGNDGKYSFSIPRTEFEDESGHYYDKDDNGNPITTPISRSYTVKETSPATEVYVNGAWRKATFVANDTTYSISISIDRTTGKMTWTATGTNGGSANRSGRSTVGAISFGTANQGGKTVNYKQVYANADITVLKVDNLGRSARGAEFTVYSDKDCKNAIGTMTDPNNNGNYIYSDISFDKALRTSSATQTKVFYIKETKPATEILFNGEWIKIGCKADSKVRKVTITWTPSNGAIEATLEVDGKNVQTVQGSYNESTFTSTVHADFSNNPVVNTITSTGSMKIEKYDDATGERLTGATFCVYNDVNGNGKFDGKDTVYCEALTDDDGDGIYLLEKMPLDKKYLVKETDAPEFYETDPNYYAFELTPKTRNVTVDNVQWKVVEGVKGEFLNHNPIIGTSLKDAKTKEHVTIVRETIKLVDTVSYNGLHVGETYVMTGTLYDKETGEVVKDENGNEITSSVTFVPETVEGTVEVEFTINTEVARKKTFVAAEKVRHEEREKWVGIHFDLEDEDQTVQVPDIHTTLTDNSTNDHVVAYPEVELTDVVTYENLVPGLEYTVSGYLMDKNTNEPLKNDNGEIITASETFTPSEKNGTVSVTFRFDRKLADNTVLVAFESLYYGDVLVVEHNDIDDVDQTVYLPRIRTTLLGQETKAHVAPKSEQITLVDTVAYENLLPGKKYTLTGTLVNKKTEDFLKNADGNVISATVEFTPETSSGKVDVTFTFDSSLLQNTTLVAFEELKYDGITVATHNDINDVDQTVNIPDIRTTLYDKDLAEDPEMRDLTRGNSIVTLVDTVFYENITPNLEYTIYGTLMIKENGEALLDKDGNPVTASATFVPEEKSGTVEVEFTVDTTDLAGKHLVAFETLEYNNVAIVVHADIKDVNQTVRVPEIGTTLTDKETGDHLSRIGENTVLTDEVSYKGLVIGKTYTVTGTLMDKETGKELAGADGKPITASAEFTAEKTDGFVEIEFTVDSSLLQGKTVVAFETILYKDVEIAIHADIEDEGQTVLFPKIGTTATVGGKKEFFPGDSITLTDTVSYENLIPGKVYELRGQLMWSSGEPFAPQAQAVVSVARFLPTTESGTVEVTFTFFGRELKQYEKLVVFEDLYLVEVVTGEDGQPAEKLTKIVSHADLNDEGQTVSVKLWIPSTGETGDSTGSVLAGLIAICLGGVIAFIVIKKKKDNE